MNKIYVITGGTGFLGLSLVPELLKDGDTLIFLGRSKKGIPLKKRLSEIFSSQNSGLDTSKIHAIEVDIDIISGEEERITREIGDIAFKVDGVWHLAAELSFKEKDRKSVFKVNLDGTKSIAMLADMLNAPLYYISTAYVHGGRTGLIREDELIKPNFFNNVYEESKFRAEEFLRDWSKKTLSGLIIFRPGILIDTDINSPVTLTSSFGYYAVAQAFGHLRKKLIFFVNRFPRFARYAGLYEKNGMLKIPFFLPNSKGCFLDFVPVASVVLCMKAIVVQPLAKGKTFHLSNLSPLPISLVIKEMLDGLHIRMSVITVSGSFGRFYFFVLKILGNVFSVIKPFSKKIFIYRFYITSHCVHDMTNTLNFVSLNSFSKFEPKTLEHIANRIRKKI